MLVLNFDKNDNKIHAKTVEWSDFIWDNLEGDYSEEHIDDMDNTEIVSCVVNKSLVKFNVLIVGVFCVEMDVFYCDSKYIISDDVWRCD